MNVCIITVYNSENCGSYYQAYALKRVIENLGHSVSFLLRDSNNSSHVRINSFKYFVMSLLRFRIRWAFKCLRTYDDFEKAHLVFDTIKESQLSEIDCIVIGSDTLWNFSEKYFLDRLKIYTGGIFNRKKITYAISVGNTPSKKLTDNKEICNYIKAIDFISVRDEKTKGIADYITGFESQLVLDPTLLLDENDYKKIERRIELKDYILIYLFGDISDGLRGEIIELKRETGEKIVSYGTYRKWADVNTTYNPDDFLAYFNNASYVITNTFHGCVFSIIFKKHFINVARDSQKVQNLLKNFGLQRREIRSCLKTEIMENIDYNIVYEKVIEERNKSILFLKNSLEA